jgi:hypothetical protein
MLGSEVIAALAVLVVLLVGNAVAVVVLRRRLKATKAGLLYARGAAQEFCRLCGGSQRMLRRVTTIWGADPLLLDAALNTLSNTEQNEIKLVKQEGAVTKHCAKIDEVTKTYSEFLGQTPFLKEGEHQWN